MDLHEAIKECSLKNGDGVFLQSNKKEVYLLDNCINLYDIIPIGIYLEKDWEVHFDKAAKKTKTKK